MKYSKFLRMLKKFGSIDKSWSGLEKPKNHTLTYALKQIEQPAKPCRLECGQLVKNQVIEYRRSNMKNIPWLEKCVSCKLYKDPRTGLMVDHRSLAQLYPKRTSFYTVDE